MYLQMTKTVKAFDLKSNKILTLDIDAITATGRKVTAHNTGKMHITGLVPPNPTKLHIVDIEYVKNHSLLSHRLCVSKEVLEDSFIELIKVQKGQKFEVLQDTSGWDNCFNCPQKVELKKGDILYAESDNGTNRGDYFFKMEDNQSVHVRECATPHPYAPAYLNPSFFKLIA